MFCLYTLVIPEGEKTLGVPVVIGGDNLLSPVGIELSDLPNIRGPVAPPGPLGSGITAPQATFPAHNLNFH